VALVIGASTAGCGTAPPVTSESRASIVYGTDDRKEYFEVTDEGTLATMSQATVALVSKTWVGPQSGPFAATTPSWGDLDGPCPGERFADQPAAAFCTGVLVDWDLVLTAGHCARATTVNDMAAVFDYFYTRPGVLGVGP
jgi:hypothetical protein